MKTISLNFAHGQQMSKPMKFRVLEFSPTSMLVESTKPNFLDAGAMRLTLDEKKGYWTNRNGCDYVEVKADRRPKPYSVASREEGRGTPTVTKFATLAELQTYVKGRWQGVEYMDALNGFHNDYATFTLTGTSLFDLGSIAPNDRWNWIWKEL